MVITLDNLAHRYQCLPSEALAKASTFDLYVMDVSNKWSNYQNARAEAQRTGKPMAPPRLSEDRLQAMLDSVKEKHK
jgi:hypothetical protein